jgi:Leucine-rich repeat (LRR) protein
MTKPAVAKKPSKELVAIYERCRGNVFENVFAKDAILVAAFIKWGKANHPRWHAEAEGSSPAGSAIALEMLLRDEVGEAIPVAFFAQLPAATQRSSIAKMKAAADATSPAKAKAKAKAKGQVTKFKLADNEYTSESTAIFGAARALTSLPEELGTCTRAKQLRVEGNKLRAIPAFVGNMKALEEADFSDNPLTEIAPELAQCTKLRKLAINNTTIKALPALPALDKLSASGTCADLIDSLAASPNITTLHIADCGLTELPESVRALKKLDFLNFTGKNKIKKLPRWLGELSLATIYWNDGLPPKELAYLQSVRKS